MPQLNQSITLDATKIMRRATITVTLKRAREMRMRLWLAVKLIRLAAWVTGMGIEIVDGKDK